MNNQSIVLGSRVAEWGSWRCATVIQDWGDSCLIEFDYYFTSKRRPSDRTMFVFKDRLDLTDYYNECWNAWLAQKEGIPSVAPQWKGK